jgi:hypothetical protein
MQCRAKVTHRPQVRSSSRSPPDIDQTHQKPYAEPMRPQRGLGAWQNQQMLQQFPMRKTVRECDASHDSDRLAVQHAGKA